MKKIRTALAGWIPLSMAFFVLCLLMIPWQATSQTIEFSPPLNELRVTSQFGIRTHPILGKPLPHNGVDLAANKSPIFNILLGTVTHLGESPTLGKFIIIRSGHLEIIYGHLSRQLVTKGEIVLPGSTIGISGKTGRVTGEHLHLSVKYQSHFLDPILFLKKLFELSLNPINEKKDE